MAEMNKMETTEIHHLKKLHKLRDRAWWTIYLLVGVACAMSALSTKYDYWLMQVLWSVTVIGGTVLAQNYVTNLLRRADDLGDERGSVRMRESCQIALGRAFARGMEVEEIHNGKSPNTVRKELLESLDLLSDDPDISASQIIGLPEGIQWTKETIELKGLEAATKAAESARPASTSRGRDGTSA